MREEGSTVLMSAGHWDGRAATEVGTTVLNDVGLRVDVP